MIPVGPDKSSFLNLSKTCLDGKYCLFFVNTLLFYRIVLWLCQVRLHHMFLVLLIFGDAGKEIFYFVEL